MPRYYAGNVPITEDIGQLERFLREETGRIQAGTDLSYRGLQFLFDTVTIAGYGEIGLNAVTPLNTINATPQVLPWDTALLADPRGVEYDLPGNGLVFRENGVWSITASITLQFAEAQAGRQLRLQLYNVTKAQDLGPVLAYFVNRNTEGDNLSFSVITDIPDNIVGDTLVIRVSSASDTFTGVSAIGGVWYANSVSEYRGDFLDRATGTASRWQ